MFCVLFFFFNQETAYEGIGGVGGSGELLRGKKGGGGGGVFFFKQKTAYEI